MIESFEVILLKYGYLGLFIASFLASTLVPFGSEGIMMLLISYKFDPFAVVVVASVGNFLGACTSYYLGFIGRGHAEKYLGVRSKEVEKAEQQFLRYGSFVLLFTWLPLIGDVIAVTSGILRLKFSIFTILVFAGKFLRYLVVAYLAGAILFT